MRDITQSDTSPCLAMTLLAIQALLLLLLLVAAPFAMQFIPFKGIYESGVWAAPHTADPLYPRRATLVLFGLASSGLGVIGFMCMVAVRSCRRYADISFALALSTFVIGWRMYPFWATGVYNVMRGRAPGIDLDPKALIPMSWFGELWRLPVLILYLVSIAGIATLLVATASCLLRKAWTRSLAMGFCLVLTLLAYGFSPGYFDWLMD